MKTGEYFFSYVEMSNQFTLTDGINVLLQTVFTELI